MALAKYIRAKNGRVLEMSATKAKERPHLGLPPYYPPGQAPVWVESDTTPGKTIVGKVTGIWPKYNYLDLYATITVVRDGGAITTSVPVDENDLFYYQIQPEDEGNEISAQVVMKTKGLYSDQEGGAALPALTAVEPVPAPPWPAQITEWTIEGIEYTSLGWRIYISLTDDVRDAALALVTAADFELRVFHGEGQPATTYTAVMVENTSKGMYEHTSKGRYPAQTLINAQLYWKRIADGEFVEGSALKTYTLPNETIVDPVIEDNYTPPTTFARTDIIVNSVSQLRSVISNRSDATSYVVGLAAGNYGTIDLSEIRSITGAPVIICSADYQALGARCTAISLYNSSNITLRFIKIDRSGVAATGGAIVNMRGAHNCRLEYCIVRGGAFSERNSNQDPYKAKEGVYIDSTSLRTPYKCEVAYCAIGGHLGKAYRAVRGNDHLTEETIVFDNGGDDFFTGNVPGWRWRNCFGARDRRIYDPTTTSSTDHDHCDFYQLYAGTGNQAREVTIRGNFFLPRPVTGRTGTPTQGICCHDNAIADFVTEQNFVTGINTPWGIALATNKSGLDQSLFRNHLFRNNASFHSIDVMIYSSKDVTLNARTLASGSGNNIHGHYSTTKLPPGGKIAMKRDGSDGSPFRQYYGGPGETLKTTSSLYEHRPVEGAPTHWLYNEAAPVGPAERWREILNLGRSPKNNPVPEIVAIFNRDYDPRNQM